MKKPKRKGVQYLNFGRNLSADACLENGQVYGWNAACEIWESYHLKVINRYYIRKKDLPKINELKKIIKTHIYPIDIRSHEKEVLINSLSSAILKRIMMREKHKRGF